MNYFYIICKGIEDRAIGVRSAAWMKVFYRLQKEIVIFWGNAMVLIFFIYLRL